MNINLKRRYPNSRTEDITDAFSRGFEVGHNDATAKSYSQGYDDGYEAGYNEASEHWQEECRKLRDAMRAILDRGETPEESGSKADRG